MYSKIDFKVCQKMSVFIKINILSTCTHWFCIRFDILRLVRFQTPRCQRVQINHWWTTTTTNKPRWTGVCHYNQGIYRLTRGRCKLKATKMIAHDDVNERATARKILKKINGLETRIVLTRAILMWRPWNLLINTTIYLYIYSYSSTYLLNVTVSTSLFAQRHGFNVGFNVSQRLFVRQREIDVQILHGFIDDTLL